jgi:hypothetical protein
MSSSALAPMETPPISESAEPFLAL